MGSGLPPEPRLRLRRMKVRKILDTTRPDQPPLLGSSGSWFCGVAMWVWLKTEQQYKLKQIFRKDYCGEENSLGISPCLALRAACAVQIGNPADLSNPRGLSPTLDYGPHQGPWQDLSLLLSLEFGGEGGSRTHGTRSVHSISSRALSATQAPLRGVQLQKAEYGFKTIACTGSSDKLSVYVSAVRTGHFT